MLENIFNWCQGESLQSITDLSIGYLLIFYAIGTLLLGLSWLIRLVYLGMYEQSDHIVRRYSQIYPFIKQLSIWGSGYIFSEVILLYSSTLRDFKNLQTFLINISFGIAMVVTIGIALVYILFIIRNEILVWLIYSSDYFHYVPTRNIETKISDEV